MCIRDSYNIADTLIVGQFLGADALAAVGSAYTLMIFLTSVLLGLCMGSGPYGTEVSENNGEIGGVLIHKGYTRLICFESNSPTDSIQDFVWTSSDNDIATVSAYGTITAKNKTGVVTITGVYKYNSKFIATIIINVV